MSKKFLILEHSNIQGFQSQKLEKKTKRPYSVYPTSLLLHYYIISKYYIYTHIIFVRRWNTKPSNAIKVVLMPPTKSKERVSNIHEVNSNIFQLLSMSHNHIRQHYIFCINTYSNYHWVFYLPFSILSERRMKHLVHTFHTSSFFLL